MSQYEYDQAPATLKIRECEAGGKILVTTEWCNWRTTHGPLVPRNPPD